MELFVVVQVGVYRHNIIGVFTTQEAATKAAMSAIKDEPDDYHEFEIARCESDTMINDVDEILRLSRENGRITFRKVG